MTPRSETSVRTSDGGFTLVELLVALSISALVTGMLVMILYQVMTVPRWGNSELNVIADLRNAGLWLVRDGNQSWKFEAGADMLYGTFAMTQTTGAAASVLYFYEDGQLKRSVQIGADVRTHTVAHRIASVGDVVFAQGPGSVTVDITPTSGTGSSQVSSTQQYVVALRVRQ
jgi:prepilin-type N-terminal cleavage/methylation domain-containing protein